MDVNWNGRTFGQLTREEREIVTRSAATQLECELNANAERISAVLDDYGPLRTITRGNFIIDRPRRLRPGSDYVRSACTCGWQSELMAVRQAEGWTLAQRDQFEHANGHRS